MTTYSADIRIEGYLTVDEAGSPSGEAMECCLPTMPFSHAT